MIRGAAKIWIKCLKMIFFGKNSQKMEVQRIQVAAKPPGGGSENFRKFFKITPPPHIVNDRSLTMIKRHTNPRLGRFTLCHLKYLKYVYEFVYALYCIPMYTNKVYKNTRHEGVNSGLAGGDFSLPPPGGG